MPTPRDQELLERRAGEREVDAIVAVLRAIFIALFAISVTLGSRTRPGSAPLLYGVVAGAVYNLLVALWYWRGFRLRGERTVIVALDLVMFSSWIYLSSDVRVAYGLFNFNFLLVGIAALWFDWTGTMLTALVASFFYLVALSRLDPTHFIANTRDALTTQIPFLFFLALVVGGLGRLQRRERERALQARALIAEHQERVRMAQELYEVLVPAEAPEMPGLDVGVRFRPYLPAGAGDYYQFVRLGERRFGFFLADISGKYASAFVKVPLVKYAFEMACREHYDPGRVLEAVNALIYEDFQPERFVSALYVIADLDQGSLVCAIAGHEPPLLVRHGRAPLRCDSSGPILGMARDIRIPVSEQALAVGDILVLCTDGVTGARNGKGDEFGDERLSELALAGSGMRLGGQQLADRVFSAVENFAPLEQRRDDVTIIVLRVDHLAPPSDAQRAAVA